MPASDHKPTAQKNLPGIFISYRRSDNPDAVGRIYDRLISEFGKARVFKDVDSIPLGQDFRGHLNDIVGGCAAVLAIIGPKWTDIRNEAGNRRLEDPDDFVRIELEAALARSVPVVPVLVGHAPMPPGSQLPPSLASLSFRQSIEVRPDPDFHNDATRLVVALRQILDPNARLPDSLSGVNARPGQSLKWKLAFAIATLAGAALAVPAVKYLREVPPPETRLEIVTPATDVPDAFELSPDGRQIVFVATAGGASRLWVRSLASTTAQPLAGTEGATAPFWSPDSRSLAYFAGGKLQRIDLGGGAPQVLVGNAEFAYGGTWSASGVIVFGSRNRVPLQRVSANGGTPVATTKLEPEQIIQAGPQFLPDGRRFLYSAFGNAEKGGIFLGTLDGKAPVRLTADESGGVFLSSGWVLWERQGVLVGQRLDAAKAQLVGDLVKIADGVNRVSVSRTGLMAYRSASAASQRRLVWMDRKGTALGTAGEPDSTLEDPRVTPDGRIAVVRTVQGNRDVFLLDGPHMTRFTFDPGRAYTPLWSPDGVRLLFLSIRQNNFDFYRKLSSGAGGEEQLTVADTRIRVPSSISPDGRYLLYFTGEAPSNDIWVLPLSGDRKPTVFLQTAADEDWSAFSPDGAWVAYASNMSGGRYEIFVRPFVPPGVAADLKGSGSAQWQVSTSGGSYPMWRADGKEIYFIDPSGAMMAAPINVKGPTPEVGTPVKLFSTRIVTSRLERGRQYDVAPDGRFLINTQLEDASPPPITLLQNWNPDARK